MFGRLISSAVRIVTLPVDVAEIVADVAVGGDGDRRSIRRAIPVPLPSAIRDEIADVAEKIDET